MKHPGSSHAGASRALATTLVVGLTAGLASLPASVTHAAALAACGEGRQAAESAQDSLRNLPGRAGFVNDFAQLIDGASALEIERLGALVQRECGGQIVVITIRSLRGAEADDAADAFAEQWGVWAGDGTSPPSVIVLLVVEGGDFQVTTSPTAGEFLDGEYLGSLIGDEVMARFSAGEHGPAFRLLVEILAGVYAERYEFELRRGFRDNASR